MNFRWRNKYQGKGIPFQNKKKQFSIKLGIRLIRFLFLSFLVHFFRFCCGNQHFYWIFRCFFGTLCRRKSVQYPNQSFYVFLPLIRSLSNEHEPAICIIETRTRRRKKEREIIICVWGGQDSDETVEKKGNEKIRNTKVSGEKKVKEKEHTIRNAKSKVTIWNGGNHSGFELAASIIWFSMSYKQNETHNFNLLNAISFKALLVCVSAVISLTTNPTQIPFHADFESKWFEMASMIWCTCAPLHADYGTVQKAMPFKWLVYKYTSTDENDKLERSTCSSLSNGEIESCTRF